MANDGCAEGKCDDTDVTAACGRVSSAGDTGQGGSDPEDHQEMIRRNSSFFFLETPTSSPFCSSIWPPSPLLYFFIYFRLMIWEWWGRKNWSWGSRSSNS